jgi:O-methyltransferase
MPTAPVEKLALLRLDGDMYGSTRVVLDALYDKLSPGGYCIVDDYNLPPVQQAISDFFIARNDTIIPTPVVIDKHGIYWRKP